ncbi:type IV secretion system DNA-binding domain-containing protein [Myxosarcina sp. GI1]|uniref:type IV secretion system DNA-binding domain-containing protein n=1 Tax=Myxosarcina sp. GI1 TaxID=1541065 RepID=UPI00069010E1|nr:type IV secretion system DNA-binding domain-containing protein [Myxosarcina sp. GI1]
MTQRKNQTPNSLGTIGTFIYLAVLLLILWGVQNQEVALMLIEHPQLILPYLIDKFGLLKLILGVLGIIFFLWLLLNSSNGNNNVLRGAKVVPRRQLKRILNRQPKPKQQPQLKLAEMPIPVEYENRGFFIVGSPGSGKTQAISQMVAVLKQRSDFRGIVFDRGGEMLEKFYDSDRDIIFNPFDARSCHWTHHYESVRPETMAAGLIPLESSKEPFFATAGRAIMAELFRQTQSNQELWTLLQSNLATLSSFVSGTLAARYLEEKKVATSVLSTVANYSEFYRSLLQPQNKALSFSDWGASDNRRWIFITLREDEAELLKPLYSLVFELMLRGLLSNEQRIRKTAIVIDELGALNKLPSLHRLLSESRKYKGCPILGTQTEAQITRTYGKENTRIILQGTKTKLMLNCADPQTAETMAAIIGKQESMYTTNNRSRSHNRGGMGRTSSQNEQLRESYAVLPSELQDLPDLRGYFKLASLPAAMVRVKVKRFPALSQRFIAFNTQVKKKASIQQQWKKYL